MSSRELVMQALTERMVAAYMRGDMIDATNLEVFLSSLESTSDETYQAMADETDYSEIA